MSDTSQPANPVASQLDVVGSNYKAEAQYGQNGSDMPSSILPGETIKRSSIAKKLGAGAPVSTDPGNWETRNISAKPIAPSPTMRNPNASPAKIPANNRPVTQPAMQRPLNSSTRRR